MLSLLVPLMPSAAQDAARIYTYRETRGGRGTETEYSITTAPGGGRIAYRTEGEEGLFVMDAAGDTTFFEMRNSRGTVSCERTSAGLVFRKDSAAVSTIRVGAEPWMGTFLLLDRYVQRGGSRGAFLMADPSERSSAVLMAREWGEENVVVFGRTYAALKVHVSLTGLGSLFWGSDFWLRKADGVLLRSREMRGPPGTPITTTELIEERDGNR
jgi:hypothetical protein